MMSSGTGYLPPDEGEATSTPYHDEGGRSGPDRQRAQIRFAGPGRRLVEDLKRSDDEMYRTGMFISM